MLNIEIKINGNMIGFINVGRQENLTSEEHTYLYNYHIVVPAQSEENDDIIMRGEVEHNYSKGVLPLIQEILDDADWSYGI